MLSLYMSRSVLSDAPCPPRCERACTRRKWVSKGAAMKWSSGSKPVVVREDGLLDREWLPQRRLKREAFFHVKVCRTEFAKLRVGSGANVQRNRLCGSVQLPASIVDVEVRNLPEPEVVSAKLG